MQWETTRENIECGLQEKQENKKTQQQEVQQHQRITQSVSISNRNKANINSDDDGSDTSADESDEEEKPAKGIRQSFACPYCKDPKTVFSSKDALENHQKDIFGLEKSDKFFVRPKLQCESCNYKVGCEATMANHMKVVHKTPESQCSLCPFKSHLKGILLHHVANEHRYS